MNRLVSVFFSLLLFFVSIMVGLCSACTTETDIISNMADTETNDNTTNDTTSNRPPGSPMRIRIGSRAFTATLADNATATAFKARLPMTISMSDRAAGAVKRERKTVQFPHQPERGTAAHQFIKSPVD